MWLLRKAGAGSIVGAYAVHAYTACGVVLAALAVVAAVGARPRDALLWLSLAVFLDATDGALARWARVDRHAPAIDGARLDDLVDYLTYVAVPMFIVWATGQLPPVWGGWVAGAVLLSSALGFSRREAKTADHFFTGFPSYWNIVVVYGLAWAWSPTTWGVILLALALGVFVPIRYLYPARTSAFQRLTLVLTSLWAVQMLAMIWWLGAEPAWLLWSAIIYPLYYVGLSLYLQQAR